MDIRAVAIFDILGFKDAIESTPLDDLVAKYENALRQMQALNRPIFDHESHSTLFPGHDPHDPWCTFHSFSDTIIMIARENNDEGCLKLLVYAWRVLQGLIAAELPVRGGIAAGEMYVNQAANIFLGKALTRAHELERKQQWIGVAIDPTVEKSYPKLFKFCKDTNHVLGNVFRVHPVPFKNGKSQELHTLNWRFNLIAEKGTRGLFSESDDPSINKKVVNTLAYAESVVKSERVYATDQEKLPVELGIMYIGAKEPPFSHGDNL